MTVIVLFEWCGDEKIMKGVYRTMAGATAKRDALIARWGWGRFEFEEVEVEE